MDRSVIRFPLTAVSQYLPYSGRIPRAGCRKQSWSRLPRSRIYKHTVRAHSNFFTCSVLTLAGIAYPAQCKSPGLITLTDDQLLFTPLHSLSPTIKIDLKTLIGVKRSGIAKGLKLGWTEVQEDGTTTEREERFLWVAGRDELFARLVGSQSGRWLHS